MTLGYRNKNRSPPGIVSRGRMEAPILGALLVRREDIWLDLIAVGQRVGGKMDLMLDPACPLLIKGLCGEIVYAKGTPGKPDPNEPAQRRPA